jgi:hypothetical protein
MNNSVGSPPGTTCRHDPNRAHAPAPRLASTGGRRSGLHSDQWHLPLTWADASRAPGTGRGSHRAVRTRCRGNGPPDRFLILLHFADPGHLAAAARALRAGGFDHPFDPGQMQRQVRRQVAAIALGLTGRFRPRAPQRPAVPPRPCASRGLEHALGQFGIFQRQVELVRRQLLGAFAELLALRGA